MERVREVLAALCEGSRGTQACINAAQTVSGIIGGNKKIKFKFFITFFRLGYNNNVCHIWLS